MIDRAYGCLVGSAIGDAMGMPASFMSPGQIKQVYGRITDFLKPDADEQQAHGMLNEGEVTDDTEESLIIASVLTEAGRFDEKLFIQKMKDWALTNKMLDSTVIGPSTRAFLEAVIHGRDYKTVCRHGDTNGAAMRVAPLGIFYHGDFDASVLNAAASALPSHGSAPGVASACAVAAAVSLSVEGQSSPAEIMDAAALAAEKGEQRGFDIPSPSVFRRILLAKDIVDANRDKPLDEICFTLYQYIGAGMKSYESIPLSLGIFYAAGGRYEEGVLAAVNTGDDADTNGAITGALCGAFSGTEKINRKWIQKIEENNPHVSFRQIARDFA